MRPRAGPAPHAAARPSLESRCDSSHNTELHVPTRNSILRISDDKTIQLIEEWEKEECLWNTNLKDYPNYEERAAAIEIIAERLAIPHFKAEHVATKFKNLRNSYSQELRKIAADKNYKPRVLWFSYIDKFLKPHLQKVKRVCTSQINSTTGITALILSDSDDEQDWSVDNTTRSEPSSSCSQSESTLPNNNRTIQSDKNGENSLQSERRKRKLSNETITVSDNEDVGAKSNDVEVKKNQTHSQEASRPSSSRQLSEHRKEDYLDKFGAYVASLLRNLPPKKALMLQPAITDLIVTVGAEVLSESEQESGADKSNS